MDHSSWFIAMIGSRKVFLIGALCRNDEGHCFVWSKGNWAVNELAIKISLNRKVHQIINRLKNHYDRWTSKLQLPLTQAFGIVKNIVNGLDFGVPF
jgi:hypothetical protein